MTIGVYKQDKIDADMMLAVAALRLVFPTDDAIYSDVEAHFRNCHIQFRSSTDPQTDGVMLFDSFASVWQWIKTKNRCGEPKLMRRVENTLFVDTKGYELQPTIVEIFRAFNPHWDEDARVPEVAFNQALDFCELLLKRLFGKAAADERAVASIREYLARDPRSPVPILDRYSEFAEAIIYQERPDARFIVMKAAGKGWNVLVGPGRSFPESWEVGQSPQDRNLSNIPGLVKLNSKTGIALTQSKEGAIALAYRAMDPPK